MSNAITPISSQFSRPYLTLDEFKDAPTTIDINNLVVGGNQAAQDAELSNVILRASSWMDQYCKQVLGATNNTEQQRVRMGSDGLIRIHPNYFPIVGLTNISWGANFMQLSSAPDPSVSWLEEQSIIYPASTMLQNWSSSGPLGFGFNSNPRAEIYVRYTYVNGYANTLLVTGNAGSSTLTVAEGIGITPNQMLTIYDGALTETVIVDESYVFGSATVPLASPLLFTHNSGVSVSALPAAIKQAAILVTTAFLKIRGDSSMTMTVGNAITETTSDNQGTASDLGVAKELLKPFRRIR